MNLAESCAREAVLKTLLDAIKEEYDAVRAETQKALEEAGASRADARLPDGTLVAKVSMSDPKPEARITDEAAFTAWVVANYPTEKTTRIVTEVRPAFATLVLAALTAAGVAEWCDTETGEVHKVPGVEIRATRSRTHSVRFEKTGREAVATAWRGGQLGNTFPLALTDGNEAEQQ